MVRHTEHAGQPRPQPRTLLLGVGADPQQAALARSEGADLVDVGAAAPGALVAIRAILPAATAWTGPPGHPLDVDRLAAAGGAAAGDPPAAVIATAAVCTWLGAPMVRSRHTRAVRRAIDMTESIAGRRLPARTIRGLA
ncbi:MAG TPA: hypothetical protein VEC76_07395 [Streptosporangiaceae bacterium]|nr:hypothetical protein [Streptosporangiaceae bacterium]